MASSKTSAVFRGSWSFKFLYMAHEINPSHLFLYSYSFNDSSTSKGGRRSSPSLFQRSTEVLSYVCSLHRVRCSGSLQCLGDPIQAQAKGWNILQDLCHGFNVVSTSHCTVRCSSLVCSPLPSFNVVKKNKNKKSEDNNLHARDGISVYLLCIFQIYSTLSTMSFEFSFVSCFTLLFKMAFSVNTLFNVDQWMYIFVVV